MFLLLCLALLLGGALLLAAAVRGKDRLGKTAQATLGLGGVALGIAGAALLALVLTGRLTLPLA